MVCKRCEDERSIEVSCLIHKDGTVKKLITFPCPECRKKGDKNGNSNKE